MVPEVELRSVLPTLPLVTLHGVWFHIASYRWRDDLFSAKGAIESPGRFHRAGGAPALYFSESPMTALLEVGMLLAAGDGSYAPFARPPQIIVAARLSIPMLTLDLTDSTIYAALGTTAMELTGNWLISENPVTQQLGQAAYDLETIVGIRFPSARTPKSTEVHANVVVFRDRLEAKSGCELTPTDPQGDLHPSIVPIVGKS